MCWPDGDFAEDEQRILEDVSDMIFASSQCGRAIWETPCLTQFLTTCMSTTSHRRLAHLLAVPVRPHDWWHGQTLLSCFVMDTRNKSLVGYECHAVRLFLQLPVCPNIGYVIGEGWRKNVPSDRHRHPGRWPHITRSLLHSTLRCKQRLDWAVTKLGSYPLCCCGSKSCKDSLDDPDVSANVARWRRWHARPAKRSWVSMLVSWATRMWLITQLEPP